MKNFFKDKYIHSVTTMTPHRISFAGGGTDYPKFYKKFDGEVLNATINQYLFGSTEAESTTSPIDTTATNFFYFEITGEASVACPSSGTPMRGKDFTVKAVNRADNEKWFSIDHKLGKVKKDGADASESTW